MSTVRPAYPRTIDGFQPVSVVVTPTACFLCRLRTVYERYRYNAGKTRFYFTLENMEVLLDRDVVFCLAAHFDG